MKRFVGLLVWAACGPGSGSPEPGRTHEGIQIGESGDEDPCVEEMEVAFDLDAPVDGLGFGPSAWIDGMIGGHGPLEVIVIINSRAAL